MIFANDTTALPLVCMLGTKIQIVGVCTLINAYSTAEIWSVQNLARKFGCLADKCASGTNLEPIFLLPGAWGIHALHMTISYPSFCLITGRSIEGEGGTVLGATVRVCISWPSPEVVTWSAISTIVPRSNSSMIAYGTFSAGSHVTAHFSLPNHSTYMCMYNNFKTSTVWRVIFVGFNFVQSPKRPSRLILWF